MKKMPIPKSREAHDMRAEYRFDYSKARPNRFAAQAKDQVVVVLDPEVAKVFKTPEAVNNALRALISAMPQTTKRKSA